MATKAQTEAKRLNAKKSTGPKTAEGKEKVRNRAVLILSEILGDV